MFKERRIFENRCSFCGTPLFMYKNTKYAEARVCPKCFKELEEANNAMKCWIMQAVELSKQGYTVDLLTGEITPNNT